MSRVEVIVVDGNMPFADLTREVELTFGVAPVSGGFDRQRFDLDKGSFYLSEDPDDFKPATEFVIDVVSHELPDPDHSRQMRFAQHIYDTLAAATRWRLQLWRGEMGLLLEERPLLAPPEDELAQSRSATANSTRAENSAMTRPAPT